MRRDTLTLIITSTLCMPPAVCLAQTKGDMRSVLLDSVVVKSHRNTSPVRHKADGTMVWNMNSLIDMPKILGTSDPIRFAQTLPGIQTNSDLHAGVNIEGCDNSHNVVMLGGVPIYNMCHLFGLFSTFNTSHYSTMNVTKAPTSAASPSRIGGVLSFEPIYTLPDSTCGEASVGLMSSQATVRALLGKHTSAIVSLRASYMNLLYGHWLQTDDSGIKYSFGDVNITIAHELDSHNTLAIDLYTGMDNGKFTDNDYQADVHAVWGNSTGAIHWLHNGGELRMTHAIYATAYRNRFSLNMQELRAKLPSSILDIGYKGRADWHRWTFSTNAALHLIHPQEVNIDGDYAVKTYSQPVAKATEYDVSADYTVPLTHALTAIVGIKGSLFHNGGDTFAACDPSVFVRYTGENGMQLHACYFLRHQYLFFTGFSEAGLPTEFWLPASYYNRPQYAHGATLGGAMTLGKGAYRVSADLFWRSLHNQIEYSGNIYDLATTVYDQNASLLHGKGRSYGASLMAQKCSGKITGWLAYTFTKATRTFNGNDMRGTYPASHERPHELNAVATYTPQKHWSFGASLVYASGTPFTAPASVGIINGNIVTKYGRHNANRFADYFRLDVSANYKWISRHGTEHGFNISLYNATARHNELYYRMRINRKKEFAYRPVSINIATLPSISYFCKF